MDLHVEWRGGGGRTEMEFIASKLNRSAISELSNSTSFCAAQCSTIGLLPLEFVYSATTYNMTEVTTGSFQSLQNITQLDFHEDGLYDHHMHTILFMYKYTNP